MVSYVHGIQVHASYKVIHPFYQNLAYLLISISLDAFLEFTLSPAKGHHFSTIRIVIVMGHCTLFMG